MKNTIIISYILVCTVSLFSCDENDVMPAYEKKGSTTATVATITASNATPATGETITLTLDFVNLASDPIETILLRAKVGSGSYADLQSFDEQSSPKDAEISHEFIYLAPAAPGTVTFEMVITSQREYAQIKRATITVQ